MTRVVLLHGFLGAPDAWGAVLELLAARGSRDLEIVVPWLPGHGKGAAPLRRLPGHADFGFDAAVESFAGGLGAEPSVWVGYSMGGRVALGIAARRPEAVRGLVLVSSHLGLSSAAARDARARDDDGFARLADAGMEALVEAHGQRSVLAAQSALPECLRAVLRARRMGHEPLAIASAIRALGLGAMPDLRGALGALGAPMIAVAGGADASYVELAQEAARIGHGEAVVVPGSGHDVVLEDPEPVADAILRVIARTSDGTRGARRVTESHP